MSRTPAQSRLDQALTRLLAGQPTTTDGTLTVSNLCREASVGRDTYYRSPQQFKDRFLAALANRSESRPELIKLREEVAELKRQRRQTARDHAAAVRQLEDTIKTYANHIQILALRNAELVDQNRLVHQHSARSSNIVALPTARRSAQTQSES